VLTFLESIGRRSDAELYLRLFRELPRESFAIIVADTQVISGALGSLVEQLRFLSELGLFAPVVLGLFRPNKAHAEARRLAHQLPLSGLKPSVHSAEETGLSDVVKDELRRDNIPIVYFNAASSPEVSARFIRLARLSRGLDSRKLVILRPQGGLKPLTGEVTLAGDDSAPSPQGGGFSVINLREDYEILRQGQALVADDGELLRNVKELLANMTEPRLAVSVTSPLNLLKELFTVRGAGTLIKAGARILRFSDYRELDATRLGGLLEATFERTLADDFFTRPVLDVYLEHDYRGTAIVHPSKLAPYLTKFAVDRPAQGEGIGRDLWAAMTRNHPRLYWRAREDNPISSWYLHHCHGMAKVGKWHVYWRGLKNEEIPRAIDDACARPEDFAKSAGTSNG
jgi:acetylglutamate kinase